MRLQTHIYIIFFFISHLEHHGIVVKFQSAQASNGRLHIALSTNLMLNLRDFGNAEWRSENCTHTTWAWGIKVGVPKDAETSRHWVGNQKAHEVLGLVPSVSQNCVKFSICFSSIGYSLQLVCTIRQSSLKLSGWFKLLTIQWASGIHGGRFWNFTTSSWRFGLCAMS